MTQKSPFKVGQWVKSHYRGQWKGRIIGLKTLKNPSYYDNGSEFEVCLVVPEIDSKGNPIRKAKARSLHPFWLSGVDVPTS